MQKKIAEYIVAIKKWNIIWYLLFAVFRKSFNNYLSQHICNYLSSSGRRVNRSTRFLIFIGTSFGIIQISEKTIKKRSRLSMATIFLKAIIFEVEAGLRVEYANLDYYVNLNPPAYKNSGYNTATLS